MVGRGSGGPLSPAGVRAQPGVGAAGGHACNQSMNGAPSVFWRARWARSEHDITGKVVCSIGAQVGHEEFTIGANVNNTDGR